jgi:VWFA-related protein
MCHTKIMRNVLMLLLCAAGFAQQPGTPDPAKTEQDLRITVPVNVVIAPTTVLDKHGDYINGLQLQDFQLLDNNKLQKITADIHDQPLSLVIVVQKSANLTDVLPKIQRIGSMLNDLIAGADGETAVVSFDHRIVTVQDFTSDTGKVSEAIKKLVPGSSNHSVNDAVIYAVRMLKKRPTDRRRVILLIAEKRDRGSQIRIREVLTEAEFVNGVIYSLDISSAVAALTSRAMPQPPPSIPTTAEHMPAGGEATPTTVDQNYYNGNYVPVIADIFKAVKGVFIPDDALQVYTRFTGGKEYPFISEKSLERAVEGISQEIHSQYLLSYAPNNQSEGGFHEIRVTVNRPNLEVRTRPGYWVAARPE